MIATLKKFFDFCAEKNRRMFYHTLVIGILIAVCEACKFPAIYLVLEGFLEDTISGSRILTGFFILLGSVILESGNDLQPIYSVSEYCYEADGCCNSYRVNWMLLKWFHGTACGNIDDDYVISGIFRT